LKSASDNTSTKNPTDGIFTIEEDQVTLVHPYPMILQLRRENHK